MTGRTPQQMLDEARRLLDDRPRAGEHIPEVQRRIIEAQWLIAEADHARVAALLEPAQPYKLIDVDDEEVERLARGAQNVRLLPSSLLRASRDPQPHPRVEACPSRFIYNETRQPSILHCLLTVPHDFHNNAGVTWGSGVAMPAEQPCDKRCAQCVERAHEWVLDAANAWWLDMEGSVEVDNALFDAVGTYRNLMGL